MVTSISGFNSSINAVGMQGMQRGASALTDDQKQQVTDILSQYDPENMTADDAKAIFDSFREAGIQPGAGLKETVEAAGFDLEQFKPEKGEGTPPPPPPSNELDVEQLQSLQTILGQYDLSNLSDDEEQTLMSSLQQAGFMGTGVLVDKKS